MRDAATQLECVHPLSYLGSPLPSCVRHLLCYYHGDGLSDPIHSPHSKIFVFLVTGRVCTRKLAVVAPCGTVTLTGTFASFGLLLNKFTTNPPAGAGPLRVTRPLALLPPLTLAGNSKTEVRVTGEVDALICR